MKKSYEKDIQLLLKILQNMDSIKRAKVISIGMAYFL